MGQAYRESKPLHVQMADGRILLLLIEEVSLKVSSLFELSLAPNVENIF